MCIRLHECHRLQEAATEQHTVGLWTRCPGWDEERAERQRLETKEEEEAVLH